MTFKDIAFKNFKSQIKKYFAYFLCSSFAIMIFFMNSTLIFNENLTENEDFNYISIIFSISMTAVVVFSLFFINYAHSAFIKSRYKEFGIYMTLGMTSKDIRKIILLENAIIIFSSLSAGLISGLIFSRLFQMIVLKILNLNNIGYGLSYKCFVVTIAVFALIFAVVIALSTLSTRKLEISELLKKSVKSEGDSKYSVLPGLIGLALIAASLIMLYIIANDKKLNTNPLAILSYVSVCFTGVYFTISNLGKTILGILKCNKKLYYNNLLIVTELNYKFNQNKRVIFVLSILSAMIVFFVASPFSLYSQTINISGMNQPNHIEYSEIGNINKITSEKLNSIIKNGKTPVEDQKTIEFIQLYFNGNADKYDLLHSKPVMSEKAYNLANNTNISVQKGHAVNIIIAWEPGNHGINPSSTISLQSGKSNYKFTVQESIHSKWVVGIAAYPTSSGIVLNNEDYDMIKSKIQSENIGVFHIINFKNWQKTDSIINNLKKVLDESNNPSNSTAKLLNIASRIDTYNSLKQGYSLFIFVTCVMGLLFFIAAGSVLYFKQYTEIGSAKAKFYRLYKLGISNKEAAGIISKELRLTFFTPLIFGAIMGYSFMYFMTYLVGGEAVMKNFMLNATKIVFAYFLFQVVFYMITKRKYVSEILDSI